MTKRKPLIEHAVRVVLKYPRNPASLLIFAQLVHDKMLENVATFTHPDPPLVTLQGLIDDLRTKQAGLGLAGAGGATKRDAAQRLLVAALMKERACVEAVAAEDPEHAAVIAALAAMTLRTTPVIYKPFLGLEPGAVSGTVDCNAKAVPSAVSYEWEISFDGGVTWLKAGATTRANMTLKDLAPKTTVHVRFRALLRYSVYTNWSNAVWIIVV